MGAGSAFKILKKEKHCASTLQPEPQRQLNWTSNCQTCKEQMHISMTLFAFHVILGRACGATSRIPESTDRGTQSFIKSNSSLRPSKTMFPGTSHASRAQTSRYPSLDQIDHILTQTLQDYIFWMWPQRESLHLLIQFSSNRAFRNPSHPGPYSLDLGTFLETMDLILPSLP